jgi:tRNA U34 5-methylaminomethyl-2-thiouridine-forming methyltransferase MnmC
MSHDPDRTRDASPIAWDADGQPRSRLYGDVYFSTTDGLAESRAVFLAGCGGGTCLRWSANGRHGFCRRRSTGASRKS